MNRYVPIITLVLVLQIICAFGQDKFRIEGMVKIEKGNLEGTSVTIEKDGENIGSRNMSSSSKIELQLDYNSTYVLTFKKPGYVTKKLLFETKAPADRLAEGFELFKFNLVLFKQYEGVNTVVFNQPVGKIYFNGDTDEFGYDTDYTKAIQAQINEVMKEVAEKQKEEEKTPPPPPPAPVVQAPPPPPPPKPDPPKPVAPTPPPPPAPVVQAPPPPPAPEPTPTPAPVEEPKAAIPVTPAPVAVAPKPERPKQDVVAPPVVSNYVRPTPPPEKEYRPYIPPEKKVIMSFFTVAQYGSADTTIYGYVNYGDGRGLQPLKKEEFNKIRTDYYDKGD